MSGSKTAEELRLTRLGEVPAELKALSCLQSSTTACLTKFKPLLSDSPSKDEILRALVMSAARNVCKFPSLLRASEAAARSAKPHLCHKTIPPHSVLPHGSKLPVFSPSLN